MQSKLTTETKRADKSDFEMKRVQDKMSGTQKEKDRLTQELQTLKESHEELQFSSLQGLSSDINTGTTLGGRCAYLVGGFVPVF